MKLSRATQRAGNAGDGGQQASESAAVTATGAAASHAVPGSLVDSGKVAADTGGASCTDGDCGTVTTGSTEVTVDSERVNDTDGIMGNG